MTFSAAHLSHLEKMNSGAACNGSKNNINYYMAKSFFSFQKNKVGILTTFVVLVVLILVYFFIYLPANEKLIQSQRFRALQNTDRNIHAKIENSLALLNNLLTEYQNGNIEKRVFLNKYIENYPKKNFILLKPDSIPSPKWAASKDSLDSEYNITVNNNTKKVTLLLVKQEINVRDTTSYQLGMVFSFEQFIRFLLPENIFDEYIIFSDNKPLYQTFSSGISYAVKDSLFNIKRGIRSSLILDQNISGTDYKMFMQPVAFEAGSEWVICGLLSNTRYQQERNQLPTMIVLLLVAILVIITIAFPLIRLYQMGSKDRLTITDGIAAMFISMLLMSLLFFVFFKYNLPLRSNATIDPKDFWPIVSAKRSLMKLMQPMKRRLLLTALWLQIHHCMKKTL